MSYPPSAFSRGEYLFLLQQAAGDDTAPESPLEKVAAPAFVGRVRAQFQQWRQASALKRALATGSVDDATVAAQRAQRPAAHIASPDYPLDPTRLAVPNSGPSTAWQPSWEAAVPPRNAAPPGLDEAVTQPRKAQTRKARTRKAPAVEAPQQPPAVAAPQQPPAVEAPQQPPAGSAAAWYRRAWDWANANRVPLGVGAAVGGAGAWAGTRTTPHPQAAAYPQYPVLYLSRSKQSSRPNVAAQLARVRDEAHTQTAAEPYQAEPYQAEPYQAEPYQAEPSQAVTWMERVGASPGFAGGALLGAASAGGAGRALVGNTPHRLARYAAPFAWSLVGGASGGYLGHQVQQYVQSQNSAQRLTARRLLGRSD